jgi:hypothetical protein
MSVPMRRVIQTLTPTEEFIRVVQSALAKREANRARGDAECAQRIQDAERMYLKPPPPETPEVSQPDLPEQA